MMTTANKSSAMASESEIALDLEADDEE